MLNETIEVIEQRVGSVQSKFVKVLMTRVNEVAQRDQWPWSLTTDGFRLVSLGMEYPGEPTSDPRVDQTMRWLLKQFVDAEWIDERLSTTR